jgi:hypothetical protein
MMKDRPQERRGGSGNGDWFVFRTFQERRFPTRQAPASEGPRSGASLPAKAFSFVNRSDSDPEAAKRPKR